MATLLLTDELAEALATAVSKGVPIGTAAQAAGLGETTVYQWLKAASLPTNVWPQSGSPMAPHVKAAAVRFAKLIAVAQATWEATQVQAINDDAAVVNAKTGMRDWRARAWLLNNHPRTRDRWHQANTLEVTRVEPFHELEQARQLSDDALLEQLALPPPP